MTTQELQSIRERFAGYDMTKARKQNGIIITGTHAGNISVDYEKATKTYRVANTNNGQLLHEGDARSTKLFIAAQYVVNAA